MPSRWFTNPIVTTISCTHCWHNNEKPPLKALPLEHGWRCADAAEWDGMSGVSVVSSSTSQNCWSDVILLGNIGTAGSAHSRVSRCCASAPTGSQHTCWGVPQLGFTFVLWLNITFLPSSLYIYVEKWSNNSNGIRSNPCHRLSTSLLGSTYSSQKSSSPQNYFQSSCSDLPQCSFEYVFVYAETFKNWKHKLTWPKPRRAVRVDRLICDVNDVFPLQIFVSRLVELLAFWR